MADLSNFMSHKLFLIRYKSYDKREIHRSLSSDITHIIRLMSYDLKSISNEINHRPLSTNRYDSYVMSNSLRVMKLIRRPLSIVSH